MCQRLRAAPNYISAGASMQPSHSMHSMYGTGRARLAPTPRGTIIPYSLFPIPYPLPSSNGSNTVNVLPLPTALSTRTRPPWASTMAFT